MASEIPWMAVCNAANLVSMVLNSLDWLVSVVCWPVRSWIGSDAMATARLIRF